MNHMLRDRHCTAFAGSRCIASGRLEEVVRVTKEAIDANDPDPIYIFDDDSELVEIDFRGSVSAVVNRIRKAAAAIEQENTGGAADTKDGKSGTSKRKSGSAVESESSSGLGRPKLGVVAREVTLLPRHWEWLNSQPGGASVTLRKLVEQARKANDGGNELRKAREVTYKFMSAMAGNERGFEEATRALFAGDQGGFNQHMEKWPKDIRHHAQKLASTCF
jgi:hypothetical protein